MNRGLLKVAIAAALASGTFVAVQASAADKPDVGGNPWSPRANGHDYRHGAIPTIQTLQRMKQWQSAHPLAANSKTLSFGGGTGGVGVMQGQNRVYLVFYGSQWGTSSTDANGNLKFTNDTAGAAGAAQQMFKGIGTNGEVWQADLTQWCDGANVASGATACPSNVQINRVAYQHNILAGAWYDNSGASPAAATAAQLANEAIKAAAHFGNTTAASNRSAYYVILSPKGTNPDSYQGSYCAWHDYTADAGVTSPYGEMAFSNQPYNLDSGTGCGVNFVNSGAAGALDGWTMTLGHEWHEMMSDQFPAGGWTNHNTGTYAGQENSDECAWIAAGQTGGAANISFSTGTFAEQASWSNDTNACAISHVIVVPPDAVPVANFSFTVNNLTATFTDASVDYIGTIVSHQWNFGDGGTSTTVNPSHTYAAAATYSVTETIADSGGMTASKTAAVTVSPPPSSLVADFSFTTSGLTANFTDVSSDSAGTIATHAWTFGDGATSTAANPSHSYAAAGTYTVTETVTDNRGATNSRSKSIYVTHGDPRYLLQNTGFETTGSWTASTGVICATGCSGESAHGGVGFAWMDGYGSAHTDTLSQQATSTILSGPATLQFYLHIDTAETSTSTAYDKLTVGVYNSSGALLKTLATYSNLNKASGYVPHSFDLSAYVNQRVTIKFTATEDSSLQTSFVLDDVTLIN